MIPKRVLAVIVAGILLLPIAMILVLGTASLLTAMQDAAGAVVLQRIALAMGLIWVLGLVGLVLALGINSLESRDDRPRDSGDEP